MAELIKIQIPKIIDHYPSTDGLKNFASHYDKNQWIILCNDRDFISSVMEEKNIEKTRLLANNILGIKEEKSNKNGGDDDRELINAS